MNLQSKSIDELFDLEQELHQSLNKDENNSLSRIISVYEELYKRIRRDRSDEYYQSMPMIKKKLVFYLVRYGSFLKTQYRKDDYTAENCLKKAVHYDRVIPIAHYRLGFLSYKRKRYSTAINHFQNAAATQDKCTNTDYCLTNQQMYNAQLYLSNSALYIAESAHSSLQTLELDAARENSPKLEMSPLYEIINHNEDYLTANAFTLETSEKESRCSKEKTEEIAVDPHPNTLILYFADRSHSLIYNGKEEELTIKQSEILRYLLLKSSEQNPAKRNDFYKIIEPNEKTGEVLANTFVQNIHRLKERMTKVGIPESIITRVPLIGESAYFFTGEIPYLIMYRTDSSFILDE
ncbi:hypothetical protein [Virgibacillus doumboii]|uniref:hypothetical protein n=1 Tax=Virgibacillus doumboii TaxID=2697503 RepID=UPI0013DEBAB0|nr:hypothetical protein [Virgibacillus doumboii]